MRLKLRRVGLCGVDDGAVAVAGTGTGTGRVGGVGGISGVGGVGDAGGTNGDDRESAFKLNGGATSATAAATKAVSALEVPWKPWVELGVLIRREKQGAPRFATWPETVDAVAEARRRMGFKLAAHLCSDACEELVFRGDVELVRQLAERGVTRVQINATKANGVDSAKLSKDAWTNVANAARQVPTVEFIIQRNDETRPLWEAFEADAAAHHHANPTPKNVSELFDPSVGRGVAFSSFGAMPSVASIPFGYAGGINPDNVVSILERMADAFEAKFGAGNGPAVWIDMESGIRDAANNDAFSVEKAKAVVDAVASLPWVQFVEDD